MIDPHVHLRDWQQKEKESLAHGLAVAKRASITAVFDMPNTNPPLTTRESIRRRLADVKALEAGVEYYIWAGVTANSEQIKEVVDATADFDGKVVGLKLYAGHSTGNMGLTDEPVQGSVYHQLAQLGYEGVVALHCEKESLMHPDLNDPSDFSSHSKVRPPEAEIVSIQDQLRLAADAGFRGHLHICHISTIEGVKIVGEAKQAGRRVSCAVTPHHLLLTEVDAKKPHLWAKMNPPLRDERQRSALFEALLGGEIDWVETDHAPHTLADKRGGASGIPGFSGLLLALKALTDAGASSDLLYQLFGGNVAALFGLREQKIVLPPYEVLQQLSAELAGEYPWDAFADLRD